MSKFHHNAKVLRGKPDAMEHRDKTGFRGTRRLREALACLASLLPPGKKPAE